MTLLIKGFSEKAYYNNILQLKKDENIFWEKPHQKWDKIVSSEIIINLPNDYLDEKVDFNSNIHFDIYTLFISVLKSMSFSITDFISDINSKEIATEDSVFFLKKTSKKYVYFLLNNKEFKINKYSTLHLNNKSNVKKGDIIASGNIYVAMSNFLNSYWYRSRPMLGFTMFTLILIYFFRKRVISLNIEKIKIQKEIDNDARNSIIKEVRVLENRDKVNEEYINLCRRFSKYDKYINPPVNTVEIENIMNQCYDLFGTQLRKAAEKITYSLYEELIGDLSKVNGGVTLNNVVYALNKRNIITFETKKKLDVIRDIGNKASHFSHAQVTKTEAIVTASKLLDVIDDINLIKKNKKLA